jgi:hypothetical protein
MTAPNPYEAPQSPDGPAPLEGRKLDDVPFYRRNSTASTLLFVALLLGFAGPMALTGLVGGLGLVGSTLVGLFFGAPLLAVCVIVLTGDVWYDTFDAQGQRNKWGFANKVVAGLIIAGWVYSIVVRFI